MEEALAALEVRCPAELAGSVGRAPAARLRVLRRLAWAEVVEGWATSRAGTPSLRSAGGMGGMAPEEDDADDDEEPMDLFTFQARGGGGGGGRSLVALVFQFEAGTERARAAAGAAGLFSRRLMSHYS